MTDVDPQAVPSDEAWQALRTLLSGTSKATAPSEELARAAVLGQVEVLALEALPALGAWLEAAVRQRLEQSVTVGFAEARVAEVMADAQADRWVALKGSASAHTLYGDSSHRARRDVDVLVHPEEVARVSEAALAAGWEDVTHATHLAGSGQRPYEREWLVPLGAHRVGCDVHQRLLRWTEFRVDVDAVIERGRALESGWRVCAPSDLLIHTALHAANAAFRVPLRSWLDVQRLVSGAELDWEHVLRTSQAWHAKRCVWAALVICQRWFDASPPQEVMNELSPGDRAAQRLKRLLGGRGQWPVCGRASRFGRARTRMRLRDVPTDALSYVWQTVTRELQHRQKGS